MREPLSFTLLILWKVSLDMRDRGPDFIALHWRSMRLYIHLDE
jgi:hypothetical protein